MPFTDYTEFQDSEFYSASPAGAQLAVKLVSDRDASKSIVGFSSHDLRGNMELVPVHEGGESGVREFARGAATYQGSGAMFFTAKRGDTISVSQENFLQLGPFTAYVYAGAAWENTAGVVYYVVEGVHFESVSIRHGAQGETTMDFSYSATNWLSGEEWAAKSATGTTG